MIICLNVANLWSNHRFYESCNITNVTHNYLFWRVFQNYILIHQGGFLRAGHTHIYIHCVYILYNYMYTLLLIMLPVANQNADNVSHDWTLNHLLHTLLSSTNETAPTTVVVHQIVNKSLITHLKVHCVFQCSTRAVNKVLVYIIHLPLARALWKLNLYWHTFVLH